MTHIIPGTKYRVRFEASFKDLSIFQGKNFRPGEEAEITAEQYAAAKRSGALLDILDTRMPNPFKGNDEVNAVMAENEPGPVAGVDPGPAPDVSAVVIVEPAKKKAGRRGKA